jgi:mRNA interferase MazF
MASQGEVWWTDLDPTRGREQAGRRPAVVVSVDPLNHGPAELVIVAPLTSKDKGIPFHARTAEHGFVKCEDVRSISVERLLSRKGSVTPGEFAQIQDRLRLLLGL